MAVMAKTLNKPFYVVAESFKFVRMYPLNQGDLPNDEKVLHHCHMHKCIHLWFDASACVVFTCTLI